jgi:hypothetical protein
MLTPSSDLVNLMSRWGRATAAGYRVAQWDGLSTETAIRRVPTLSADLSQRGRQQVGDATGLRSVNTKEPQGM